MRAIRIGIDVGGTFTDAVALDEATGELVSQVKVPTTHDAPEGVAAGIVEALHRLLEQVHLQTSQVRFIAHGTTQATNALLEGDVMPVGILATGRGLEGRRASVETALGNLELSPGKWLFVAHRYLEAGASGAEPQSVAEAIRELVAAGSGVIVAAEPFSVDDPSGEARLMEAAAKQGLPATGTHEMTGLLGLRVRTRTAVINASILPRMVHTSVLTQGAVRSAGIQAPLMVMRGDGGVMTMEGMRRHPIRTLLSGPAAGVAGALMHARISDGLFLEVGGTSTDISAIKDGRVVVDYANVGGHPTYVSALEVKTVGVAAGSLVRLGTHRIVDVGPRSAHIAGLRYAVYAEPAEIVEPVLETFAPKPGDPADYVLVCCRGEQRFALTPSCAANLLGLVQDGDFARGNVESARRAFAPLARALGTDETGAARAVLEACLAKLEPVARQLAGRHQLVGPGLILAGGGGGCAALVPYLGQKMKLRTHLVQHHEVISPIGVALALVREVVERTAVNPSTQLIGQIREEARAAALRGGAADGTVEVEIEVEPARNLVRAIATGATEMRARTHAPAGLDEAGLASAAAAALGAGPAELVAQTGRWSLFRIVMERKGWLGLGKRREELHALVERDGTVRRKFGPVHWGQTTAGQCAEVLARMLAALTVHGDGGASIPRAYLLCGERLVDLSGLVTSEQVLALAKSELEGTPAETEVVNLCSPRS